MLNIFLDTEFTDFADLQLISIGLVADDGAEFYAEVDLPGRDVASSSETLLCVSSVTSPTVSFYTGLGSAAIQCKVHQRRINVQAYGALERLADHFGIPKRQVIEDLIVILDTDVSKMTELDLSG